MAIRRKDIIRVFQTARTLKRVWVFVFFLGLYSCVPVLKEYSQYSTFADFPSNLTSILGLVLSLVLVFRTNRAYERWWEARTLWGQLVNISRNTAIKLRRFADLNLDERTELHRTISGFSCALKGHLQDGVVLSNLPGWKHIDVNPQHVPAWLADHLYGQLKSLESQQRLSPQELLAVDSDAREFLNVCGGCERIRNTLITGSYRSYALKSLLLYLLILPWGLVQDLNWLAVPITMIIGYMMVGLEAIADTIEEPFGDDLDDLDLAALCKTIDVSTGEILDVSPLVASEQV